MTHHVDWLYVSDIYGNPAEIVNEHRTAALLRAANLAQFTDVTVNGCPALAYEPCAMDSSGAVAEWVLIDDDITAAPWFDPTSQASMEGCGFYIDEWTGIDGAHHTRAAVPRGSGAGGAVFGAQSQRQRVMAFNLLAVGETDRGLNHLFRWLETTLLRSCTTDGTGTLWLREFCPEGTTDGDLEEGLCSSGEVVLIDGPTWVEPPIVTAGHHMRMLTFTLAAGDPCLRRPPSTAASSTSLPSVAPDAGGVFVLANCGEFAGTSLQVTQALTPPPYGAVSAIVTITSPKETGTELPTLRIFGLADHAGTGIADPCGLPRSGLMILEGIPSGFEVVVDCSSAAVMVRDLYGAADWVDGSAYLQPNIVFDPTFVGRRGFSFAKCAGAFVVVEPAITGAQQADGAASLVSTYTVETQSVVLFGCGGR